MDKQGITARDDAAVGKEIAARRLALRLSMAEAAAKRKLGVNTWREYERGHERPRRPLSEVKVAQALDWPDDAIARLRAGEDPASFVQTADDDDRVDALRHEVAALRGLVDELITELHRDQQPADERSR